MKFQSLFAIAALGSSTLAFPAWPQKMSKGDEGEVMPHYPISDIKWQPTGIVPTKIHHTGGYPTGGHPKGTGHSKHTGPHSTGHHTHVYPTDKPILPRHKKHPHPTGGYPMPTGIFPMPSGGFPLSSLKIEHDTESHTKAHPPGGPWFGKRHTSAPYPYETEGAAEKTEDCSSEKHAHKTGHKTGYKTGHKTVHKTGTHPHPTGVKPTKSHPIGKPTEFPMTY